MGREVQELRAEHVGGVLTEFQRRVRVPSPNLAF